MRDTALDREYDVIDASRGWDDFGRLNITRSAGDVPEKQNSRHQAAVSYAIRYLALSAIMPCRSADGREISEVSSVHAPGFRARKEESGAMTS